MRAALTTACSEVVRLNEPNRLHAGMHQHQQQSCPSQRRITCPQALLTSLPPGHPLKQSFKHGGPQINRLQFCCVVTPRYGFINLFKK